MAMTRPYSRVTHRPAALICNPKGGILMLVIGSGLGVFVGQRLSQRMVWLGRTARGKRLT